MYYAVNTKTKEHRITTVKRDDEAWVKADADGWIDWHGGANPLPNGHPYQTKHASGDTFKGSRPETFGVHWRGEHCYRVTAYRPILDDKEQEMSEQDWPQPGDMAEVHNEPGYEVVYGDDVIGADVQVKARFRSGCVDMAAVERDGMCFCFRVDMLRPIRTAAQRAEDEAVEEMRVIYRQHIDGIRALYRAGYRKVET